MAVSGTLYYQVMEKIRGDILSGIYPVGTKLPSEPELQSKYGVSRVTIRNAVDGLVADGLVERVQGTGTFVRKPQKVSRLVRTSTVESFSAVARQNGFDPSSKVLAIKEVALSKHLESIFRGTTDRLLYVERLRYLDGDPIMIENNYYPLPRFARLQQMDLVHRSLYELFHDEFNIHELSSDDTTLSVVFASQEQAKLLKRSVGFPLFYLVTVIEDENKMPVQYGEQYIATDRYQFKI